jgi:peptidyl-prolyl cis-trans isomerase C
VKLAQSRSLKYIFMKEVMTFKNTLMRQATLACAAFALTSAAFAADTAIATVNGVKIGSDVLEFLVANNVAQGVKDTPELRSALRTELISREVLVQEAKKQNLDKEQAFKLQWLMQQNSLLIDSLLAKQFGNLNLSEEKLRAEYKRQVDLLGDAEQYQVSHIVLTTEAEAKAVIKALNTKNGPAFSKVAREKSTHASAQNGGNLGWLLPNQIIPAVANVVVNLNVGSITSMPIATPEGWQIIKLDGKRPFKVPTFEESKQQLANAVFANERTEFVQKLVNAAKVD